MEGGLRTKQHLEELAEAAVYPFGSNNAVYPRVSEAKKIDWFTKKLSRRRPVLRKYETCWATTIF